MTFFFISLLFFENVLFFFFLSFFYRMLCCILQIYTHPIINLIRRERERTCAFDKRKKRDDAWNFILSLPCLLLYLYVCVSKKSRETFDSSIHIHTSEIRLSVRFALSSTSIYVRIKKNEEIAKTLNRWLIWPSWQKGIVHLCMCSELTQIIDFIQPCLIDISGSVRFFYYYFFSFLFLSSFILVNSTC